MAGSAMGKSCHPGCCRSPGQERRRNPQPAHWLQEAALGCRRPGHWVAVDSLLLPSGQQSIPWTQVLAAELLQEDKSLPMCYIF